jgi:hypothetical protein
MFIQEFIELIDQVTKAFLCQILKPFHLNAPDGRPLYAYKVPLEIFQKLEDFLKRLIECLQLLNDKNGQSDTPLNFLARYVDDFPPLFVLYAAEWWRRRFDGSRWSWEPILEDIGAADLQWNTVQRSICVTRGFRIWKIEPRSDGGLRYLGSIAVQGGLPLKLLAQAQGSIGQLLADVFKFSAGHSVSELSLKSWIESLQGLLPQSYRHPIIFMLLAQVAWTVLSLKTEAKLDSQSDPIENLDKSVPNWRQRFPLPIEDEHARGLIEQLVRDAARTKAKRLTTFLSVERRLELNGQHQWELVSNLDLPETLKTDALAQIFAVHPEELPRTLELTLQCGEDRHETSMRRMAGAEAYRVERTPMECKGISAACEQVLHLRSTDGRQWSATAHKGRALDDDLPWIFSVVDGRMLRQGGGSISEAEVWVAFPHGWQLLSEPYSKVSDHGSLLPFARRLVRLQGTMRVRNESEHMFRLRTEETAGEEENFIWQGRRLWITCKPFQNIFLGMPSLNRIGHDQTLQRIEGEVTWQRIGGSTEGPLIGPTLAQYKVRGEIQISQRMLLLAKNAEVTIEAIDAHAGTICLSNWGCIAATCRTIGVRMNYRLEDNRMLLDVRTETEGLPVEWVDIEMRWPFTTTSATCRFPFPVKGVRAFDATGKEIPSNSLLAVHLLAGVRLYVMIGHRNQNMRLSFSICHHVRFHPLKPTANQLRMEIRLQDYLEDIHHLLSTDDHPDACVLVQLYMGAEEAFVLRLARYAVQLTLEEDRVLLPVPAISKVGPEELSKLPVLALRIESPRDEAIPLSPTMTNTPHWCAWHFSPEEREPGAWLIYPGPNAALPFRPTLWTVVGEDASADSRLARAISLKDPQNRAIEIDRCIQMLAADFLFPDWAEVEDLVGQIGHLPFPTLDLWRRMVRNPFGMAAIALRFAHWPIGFLERFAQELPFAWETVPFSAWQKAIPLLSRQCTHMYGEQAGPIVFQSHLDSRIQELTARYGALSYLLGLARTCYLPERQKEASVLKAVGEQAEYHLFRGENSLLMKLRRLHAEDEWPIDSAQIVHKARADKKISIYLNKERLGYADGVINMPLVLAVQVATDQVDDWFSRPETIHVLRTHRAFDPDWFDDAYNMTISRCFRDGLLEWQLS